MNKDNTYKFNVKRSNIKEKINVLNYVSNNHFLLFLKYVKFIDNLTVL